MLRRLRDLIQTDVNQRGLAADPVRNLITACPDDFALACRSLAEHPRPVLAIVTGFFIPTAQPPCGETDGPLGAVFLARALTSLGIRVVLATDAFVAPPTQTGLNVCGLRRDVPLVILPAYDEAFNQSADQYFENFLQSMGGPPPTHLLAIERVGPSHTLASLQAQCGQESAGETVLDFLDAVPQEHQDRCHTMRGLDITPHMSPAHHLFEVAQRRSDIVTIGIGDGGNEIGMGRIPWDVIARNVPSGGLVACRIATQRLIVCGVSNWGGYALAAGVWHLRNQKPPPHLFRTEIEARVLQAMVERGPLVDGVTGKPAATVDGLSFEKYAAPLEAMRTLIG